MVTASAGSWSVVLSESWSNPTSQTLPLVPGTFSPRVNRQPLPRPLCGGSVSDLQQVLAERDSDGFGAVCDSELLENGRDVLGDHRHTDVEGL